MDQIIIESLLSPIELDKYISETNQINADLCFYRLHVDRPNWLDVETIWHSKNLIFKGYSKEEVFIKMYKYCLNNLIWEKTGDNVNLFKYSVQNDTNQIIRNLADVGIIEINSENEILIFNEITRKYLPLTINNYKRYSNYLIKYIIYANLFFYGFEGDHNDLGFYVSEVIIY